MITYNKFIIRANGKTTAINTTAYGYTYNKIEGHTARRESFQERLLYWMDTNGVSQNELVKLLKAHAWRLGYGANDGITFSNSCMSSYCRGLCCPKIDRLTFMAKAMGVSKDWLTGYAPKYNEHIDLRGNAPILNLGSGNAA